MSMIILTPKKSPSMSQDPKYRNKIHNSTLRFGIQVQPVSFNVLVNVSDVSSAPDCLDHPRSLHTNFPPARTTLVHPPECQKYFHTTPLV